MTNEFERRKFRRVDNSPRYALGAAGAKRVHHAFSKSPRDEAIIDTERRK